MRCNAESATSDTMNEISLSFGASLCLRPLFLDSTTAKNPLKNFVANFTRISFQICGCVNILRKKVPISLELKASVHLLVQKIQMLFFSKIEINLMTYFFGIIVWAIHLFRLGTLVRFCENETGVYESNKSEILVVSQN